MFNERMKVINKNLAHSQAELKKSDERERRDFVTRELVDKHKRYLSSLTFLNENERSILLTVFIGIAKGTK